MFSKKIERKGNADVNLPCVLFLGINLSQGTLDPIAARFNNKEGNLAFDDFLQIICRIYSVKGASAILSFCIMLYRLTTRPTGHLTYRLAS